MIFKMPVFYHLSNRSHIINNYVNFGENKSDSNLQLKSKLKYTKAIVRNYHFYL